MTRPGGTWRNWARTHSARPARVEYPADVAAVRRAVTAAAARSLRLKAVGSGHSFSGIAVPQDVLVDLSDLRGIVAVDIERARVTVRAGTRLWEMPRLLAPYGLAMQNLGDIDRQTVAGAISTGTHGTGARFPGLSAQVVGVTLVAGDGALVTVDEDNEPELLPAVALGLGALGVIVEVTLQCVPAFLLEAVERPEPVAETLAGIAAHTAADHFEFYWFPGTDVAVTKTNTRLPERAVRRPLPRVRRFVDESLMANGVYRVTCAAGAVVPAAIPPVSRLAGRTFGNRTYTDHSARVFTQHRSVRFREMEYAVPAERLVIVMRQLQDLILERGWRISFPVEVRVAAADDRWLSTAYERDSAYFAVHRYWREDPAEYFEAVEELMTAHAGRPHWGKEHDLDADALRERYPRFDDFAAARDRLDPARVFANAYLDRVLGG
ncbi:D-arabinono-1,4-lactone oxidase [Microbacterium lushaniae]|uniref:FAD-binding protein n=1 Tax=Microbacterium lushaniae TaxID=2614639 RepID=A0A5J6L5J6_9MICO|nr:D-arabinono-1,4-lactone oxidase [Microbacterium lushaniae]QEW03651.1 FAD-binding protein [Microbacterium lushaniae]